MFQKDAYCYLSTFQMEAAQATIFIDCKNAILWHLLMRGEACLLKFQLFSSTEFKNLKIHRFEKGRGTFVGCCFAEARFFEFFIFACNLLCACATSNCFTDLIVGSKSVISRQIKALPKIRPEGDRPKTILISNTFMLGQRYLEKRFITLKFGKRRHHY